MEESIRRIFSLSGRDARTYSPLSLAYIGDSVYELIIRTCLTEEKELSSKEYTKLSSGLSKAPAQARIADAIMGMLSPAEAEAFRRGKNASPHSIAKSGTPMDYHIATGLESLIGWLYVTGAEERAIELIKTGMETMSDGR